MKQRWLPGFDGAELEEPAAIEGADRDPPATEADACRIPVLPGQVALFTAERELLGLLESALLDGRFEEALDLRNALSRREGASPDTIELALLDEIGQPAFWDEPVGTCIDRWLDLRSRWDARPGVKAQVRDGALRRLVRAHGAAAVVRIRPSLLPPIVNLLGTLASADEFSAADALLRDALADGLSARSDEFDDPRFVDLLSDNRSPAWLACVGALNRVWPVPELSADAIALPLPPVPEEEDEDGRGAQFWCCLRIAVSHPRDSAGGIEARKRMRLLDAGLHGQFMRQGVRRE